VLASFKAGCNVAFGGSIGTKFVPNHGTRRAPTFQKLERKRLGSGHISPKLDENVEDVHCPVCDCQAICRGAVRVDRTPQPICLTFDPNDNLVEMSLGGRHWIIKSDLDGEPAHFKEEQEKAVPPPKVKPVSAKNGYQKTGRHPPGRPAKMEAYYERRRAERAAQS